MSEPLRFGLVGCGRIGATADERVKSWPMAGVWLPYSHAGAVVATPGAALVAVCDVDGTAARAAAALHGAPAAYTDAAEMLTRERLDVLCIATRTRERGPLIESALAHGVRALYCEKPLSNTLEDADRLAAAVREKGVCFVYGTKRRYMPVYHRVRERVRAGEIGELVSIVVKSGVAPLLWNHPHSVDIATFFAGDAPAESVQADLDLGESQIEGDTLDGDPPIRMAQIRFSGGVGATIVAADSGDVELHGRAGSLCVRADGAEVRVRRPASGVDLGWLLDESAERVAEDAVRNQEILFAMAESELGGGRRVALPLPRRGLRITGRSGHLYA
jgi:predicted dehydrogenase